VLAETGWDGAGSSSIRAGFFGSFVAESCFPLAGF
jgi:hypothetical protein